MHEKLKTNSIDNKWFFVLVYFALFLAFVSKITDLDIWYHLSIGKEVLSQRSIPETEFLVYPNLGDPTVFHEWGFGVLMYAAHQLGGLSGITLLNAGLLATTCLLLWRGLMQSSTKRSIALLLAFGLAAIITQDRYFRPETVLFLALAVEFYALERYAQTLDWRRLVPIPLAAFFLSQVHPSAIFILYILACYGAWQLLQSKSDHKLFKQQLINFSLTAILVLLFASINPYGFAQVFEPLYFTASNKVLLGVLEFMPSFSVDRSAWLFILLSGVALISLLFDRERVVLNVLIIGAFGFLAFKYARNLSLFALILYIPAGRALSKFTPAFGKSLNLGATVLVFLFLGWKTTSNTWGVGIESSYANIPVRSADIINAIKPSGRLFNSYGFGGYFGWTLKENHQVFIDGRNNRLTRSYAVYGSLMGGRAGWQKALDSYNINTVAIQTSNLVELLLDSDDWQLALAEDNQFVFFRESMTPKLPESAVLDKNSGWQALASRTRRQLANNPNNAVAQLRMARVAGRLGDSATAINAYEKYIELQPDDWVVKQEFLEFRESF